MRKLDLYWMSNKEWREIRSHTPVVKENAPTEARKSYERYLEQTTDTEYNRAAL